MSEKIRVSVDAMGGDFAPASEIDGAIMALEKKHNELEVILVGKKDLLESELAKRNYSGDGIRIVNAEEVVTMEDSPTESYKSKPDSSLIVSLNVQKQGDADASISAGNTGAMMAASVLKLGRIKGVGRPTIGALFPSEKGYTMLFDVGASVDCKAQHLLEYGVMGSIYMSRVLGINNPSVALLNVGEEKSKGNELTFEAYELLEKSDLNFAGNVEGRDILDGKYDVIVCDGFTGNIILKFAESVPSTLKHKFKKYASENIFKKLWVGMMYSTLKKILSDFDYQNYGGVPLLGVNGVSIIGHGKSTPKAIMNMIITAMNVVKSGVNSKIADSLAK